MKLCPECHIDVDLPGRSEIKFCPFCGTSLKLGKEQRKARISFFAFPLVILILSIIFASTLAGFPENIKLGSDIGGKLTICFFLGAFFYSAIIRVLKQKSHFSSFKNAGATATILSILSYYLAHDINLRNNNELGLFTAPDIFLTEKTKLWITMLASSILVAAIIAFIQNLSLNNKIENKPYSKIGSKLTIVLCVIGVISVYVLFYNHAYEDRVVIASEMIFNAGSQDKAIKIINFGIERLQKAKKIKSKRLQYFKGKLSVISDFKYNSYNDAYDNLKAALEDYSDSPMVKHYLSKACFAAGKKTEALEYAKEAYETASNSASLSSSLADIYRDLGKTTQAIEAYRTTLSLNNNDVISMNNLSYLLLNEGKELPQALELAIKAEKLLPTTFTIDTLAWAYYKNNKISDALDTIKRIERFADEMPEIKFHYIMISNEIGLLRNCELELDKLLALPEVSVNQILRTEIEEAKVNLLIQKENSANKNE